MEQNLIRPRLGRDGWNTLEGAVRREWLVTNGLGGYACGTVGEVNTRRYHGLLMAAFAPPLGRTLLVAALDTEVRYGGERYPLATHEYGDGTVDPRGYLHLESFHLDRGTPVWRYALADALLEKRLLMAPGRNTTYVSFRVVRAGGALELEWTPLCSYRDYHGHTHGGWEMAVREIPGGFEIEAFAGARLLRVLCPGANVVCDPAWHWNFHHREEAARGLDDREDLFRPGRLHLSFAPGEETAVVLTAESEPPREIATVQAQVRRQQDALLQALPAASPTWICQLALAADRFVVERRSGWVVGRTVIAGYPWFGDWGRDAMIALPGLTLVTGRFEVAASILRTFADYVSEGMLPNRFPDDGALPEYNTVDATLWYFHAIDQFTRRSGDCSLAAELYAVLADILDWHRRGTRYGIRVDPSDGLLAAGEAGVALTWMDAKVGDWVVIPRIGKAVEVNALWYNALAVMAELSSRLGRDGRVTAYREAARRAKAGFGRFWNPARGCLYDVIDGPEGQPGADGRNYDARLRPNQLLAVSLPHSPLEPARRKAVVDICARKLLTSHGLRSLAPGEPGYVGRYGGRPYERDAAYHQGTVWAWLIWPFVDAHYRVYGDVETARSFLEPLALHLDAACLGSVSEIFDGDPPHRARGCFAQAWSVACLLDTWWRLHRGQHKG